MLYSLCFAGKAKQHVVCSFCLNDNHTTQHCPKNQNTIVTASASWFNTAMMPPVRVHHQVKLCNLFNAPGGTRCNYHQCKFAHKYSACRGPHARFYCHKFPVNGVASAHGGNRVVNTKCLRMTPSALFTSWIRDYCYQQCYNNIWVIPYAVWFCWMCWNSAFMQIITWLIILSMLIGMTQVV